MHACMHVAHPAHPTLDGLETPIYTRTTKASAFQPGSYPGKISPATAPPVYSVPQIEAAGHFPHSFCNKIWKATGKCNNRRISSRKVPSITIACLSRPVYPQYEAAVWATPTHSCPHLCPTQTLHAATSCFMSHVSRTHAKNLQDSVTGKKNDTTMPRVAEALPRGQNEF